MSNSQTLGFNLHYLSFMLDRQSDLFLRDRFQIGFSQFKILMALMKRTNVQQKEIADFLGQTEASVSRQIQNLGDLGLLHRRRDPENRRQHITQLTDKGEKLARGAIAELEKHYAPMFAVLSDSDQQKLAVSIDKLRDYAHANMRYGYWQSRSHRSGR